jgi:hypothetical protein
MRAAVDECCEISGAITHDNYRGSANGRGEEIMWVRGLTGHAQKDPAAAEDMGKFVLE